MLVQQKGSVNLSDSEGGGAHVLGHLYAEA